MPMLRMLARLGTYCHLVHCHRHHYRYYCARCFIRYILDAADAV